MKRRICINEICARDGFQNIEEFIPTDEKLKVIDDVIRAGVKKVQCTSFTSPKAIPQMRDAKEVAETCIEKYRDSEVIISALIPNYKGAETAVETGVRHLNYVTSVTEAHNMSNVRKTIHESMEELARIHEDFPELKLSCDIAMAFGCCFEGAVSVKQLLEHIRMEYEIGIREFTLCDTIGIAVPDDIKEKISAVLKEFDDCTFKVHIHDTRNMGMINTFTAIECGIDEVEVSLGGLGGCPYARGAGGNTSSEDLVYMLERMGYDTQIDFKKYLSAAKELHERVPGNYTGHHIRIKDTCKTQQ